MSILGAVTLLLACQLVGEVAVRLSGVPVPGAVVGMMVLFAFLCIRGEVEDSVDKGTHALLDNLSFLFVPAGVGVIGYLGRLEREWAALAGAVVLGTAFAIGVTAWITQRVLRRSARTEPRP